MDRYELHPERPVDAPLEIRLVENEVVFIGPGPIAFSMTMSAAVETARRLNRTVAAAARARRKSDD